jgi:hypothetical protein
MLALAPRQSVPLDDYNRDEDLMPPESFTDHFTPNDRRELITTGVKLENLAAAFTKLEGTISNGQAELGRRMDRFDERVRALENFRYWMLGGAAVGGALAGYLGRFFHP